MSAEEDIELKNLVAQALENKGVLPKIRAELRANVFLALEENLSTRDALLKNNELSAFIKVPIGTLVLNLIREFLEFFELEFTLSVFEPETKYGKEYNGIARDKMINELKIADNNKKNPLLFDVIDKVVNTNKLHTEKNEKVEKESKINNHNEESGSIIFSPVALNTTFVKQTENDSVKSSPKDRDSKDDSNDSIKEEVISNNFSDDKSSSEAQLALDNISRMKPEPSLSSSSDKSNENETNITKAAQMETLEIDLLTFTPVKDTKSMDSVKSVLVDDDNQEKIEEKKEKLKSSSMLGDLPPLQSQLEEKDFDMKDLKAMMGGWSDKKKFRNSEGDHEVNVKDVLNKSLFKSKPEISDKSQNSEISEADDFEEDTSDLESNNATPDTPHTIDETISKASYAADYLENL